MRKVHSDFKRAVRLLDQAEVAQALALGQQLIGSLEESDRLDGYLCLGFVYEDGGPGFAPDLDKALDSFRRASLIAPNAITFLNLARVSLKQKEHAAALRFLYLSADYEVMPETLLGFGHYFEAHLPSGSAKARAYYIKAAMRGRFAGFFGYSRVARASGQVVRAFLMDLLRIVFGPFIALAIGTRARFQF